VSPSRGKINTRPEESDFNASEQAAIKQRAIVGAAAGAVVPWLVSLLFLSIVKLIFLALLSIREFLVVGTALLGGYGGYRSSQTHGHSDKESTITTVIAALFAGGLMYGLMSLVAIGHEKASTLVTSTVASFGWFLLGGGIIGGIIGAIVGYIETQRGSLFSLRRRPRAFTFDQPAQLNSNPRASLNERDALTQEPLDGTRPVYRCLNCQAQYLEATLRSENNRCANQRCNQTSFERVV
jgi:hypothetical protein